MPPPDRSGGGSRIKPPMASRPPVAYRISLILSLSKGEAALKKRGCDAWIAAIETDGPSLWGLRFPGSSYWLSMDSAMRRSSSFSWSPYR
jgi:hypothetical protein